jgi:DNA-binding response OmpR family regulator
MSNKVLVVDDNQDVRIFVRTALESEGFTVVEAEDGTTAMKVFEREHPSLVLLDLTMGQPDGFEVCRSIRKISAIPIIMLTNRVEEVDEAMCLAAGADDYITKPVSARILALRVSNELRKFHAQEGPIEVKVLEVDNMKLNLETHEFFVADTEVKLTRIEFDFLTLLMRFPKRVYMREQVLIAIGGSADYSSDHLLDTHASRLRLKIKAAGGPRVISAVRGVGYRLMTGAAE